MIISAHAIGFIAPGFSEGLCILMALLLLFGVKDAPRVARNLTDFFQKIRYLATEFRHEFMYGEMRAEADARGKESPEEDNPDAQGWIEEEVRVDGSEDVE